eukprot:TRINITY_DN1904_c0_g1_i2.p1 TRINITY_DN1904_c0_g1~~TRINITY_DN1904_c0_g1_i2.p1  ORF type:complete len:523 (+),score=79.18 TRINITY_DN1904_c0_g1_i2:65-1633(+)
MCIRDRNSMTSKGSSELEHARKKFEKNKNIVTGLTEKLEELTNEGQKYTMRYQQLQEEQQRLEKQLEKYNKKVFEATDLLESQKNRRRQVMRDTEETCMGMFHMLVKEAVFKGAVEELPATKKRTSMAELSFNNDMKETMGGGNFYSIEIIDAYKTITFHVYPEKVATFEDLKDTVSGLLGYSRDTIYFKDMSGPEGRYFYQKSKLVDQLFPLGMKFNSFLPQVFVEIRNKRDARAKKNKAIGNTVELEKVPPKPKGLTTKQKREEAIRRTWNRFKAILRFFNRLSSLAFLLLWGVYWTITRASYDKYTALQTVKTYSDEMNSIFLKGEFRNIIDDWILEASKKGLTMVMLPYFKLTQKRKKAIDCSVPLFKERYRMSCLSDEWDYDVINIEADFGKDVSYSKFQINEDVDNSGQYVYFNHLKKDELPKQLDKLWTSEWISPSIRYLVLSMNFFNPDSVKACRMYVIGDFNLYPEARLKTKIFIIDMEDKLTAVLMLSLIHISEPTRQAEISYAVFCLKKKT